MQRCKRMHCVGQKETYMLQIAAVILALVVIYAIKAFAITKTHEELSANSTAFSWVRADADEEGAVPIWATGDVDEAEAAPSRVPVAGFRRVRA